MALHRIGFTRSQYLFILNSTMTEMDAPSVRNVFLDVRD